eukprot:142215_1
MQMKHNIRQMMIDRLMKPHNLPLWIKLGLFPPRSKWIEQHGFNAHPHFIRRDIPEQKVTQWKEHYPYEHNWSQQNFGRTPKPRAFDPYYGFAKYWLEIRFTSDCNVYNDFISKWQLAHKEGLIGYEWICEPHMNKVYEVTQTPQASALRKEMLRGIPSHNDLFAAWPYKAVFYGDYSTGKEYNGSLDMEIIAMAQEKLKDNLARVYNITNFNPYRVSAKYNNKSSRTKMKNYNNRQKAKKLQRNNQQ